MKNSFFSKLLVILFLFGSLSVSSQVRIKTNKSKVVKTNKTKVVKKNRPNHYNDKRGIRAKNKHRIVVKKPNRPRVVVTRPNYNRHGYIWAEGYWKWNAFFGRYTWQKARWIKAKRNHYWVPGFWEITVGGFFWVEGYWALEF